MSYETVLNYAKHDCFEIRPDLSFDLNHKLQTFHKSMSLEQFKAFIKGTIEIKQPYFCRDLIIFINTLETIEKAKLFDV